MSLLTIDIGGTSIKYARFADGKLGEEVLSELLIIWINFINH